MPHTNHGDFFFSSYPPPFLRASHWPLGRRPSSKRTNCANRKIGGRFHSGTRGCRCLSPWSVRPWEEHGQRSPTPFKPPDQRHNQRAEIAPSPPMSVAFPENLGFAQAPRRCRSCCECRGYDFAEKISGDRRSASPIGPMRRVCVMNNMRRQQTLAAPEFRRVRALIVVRICASRDLAKRKGRAILGRLSLGSCSRPAASTTPGRSPPIAPF